MKIISMQPVDSENEEIEFEITTEERDKIKKTMGWKRLTKKRLNKWFLETLNNTLNMEN